MINKLTTDDFIQKSKTLHNDKYDYSKVEYINTKTKVCIICPEHGEFWQVPNYHISGCGCPKCGNKGNMQTTTNFIVRAKQTHGDKYDYSKVEYKGIYEKVCIICPEHGEFWQVPNAHLNNKKGCPKCGIINNALNRRHNINNLINKANYIHNNKYDYSKVEYKNLQTKVCIICPEHGEFWQTLDKHINRQHGCPKCGLIQRAKKRNLTTKDFIELAKEVHGDKYDYSKVDYTKSRNKVCIICPEHGEFWQTPNKHIVGKQGCPYCKKYGKKEIILYEHIKQKYNNCEVISNYTNKEILNRQSFDIYLPQYKIAIEYQGAQHFQPLEIYGGYNGFIQTIKRDKKKFNICRKNNIKLFYFCYDKNFIPSEYLDIVYYDEKDLFKKMDELIT